MNIPIRARYFRSLALLLTASCAAFLVLFSFYEWKEHGGFKHEALDEILYLLGLMLLMAPFVLWAAWQIAGQLLHPLRAVLGTAERIRAGNLNERIPTGGRPSDELARLANALNDAFDRYAEGVARLERFSADASHQLRTPLAALRTAAEVCLQQERDPDHYREALGQILEETARMQHTVDQLLQLARLDPALLRSADRVDLRLLVCQWVEETQLLAEDRGITVERPANDGPAWVHAHATLLREVFLNLFNNALAATPEGGTIRVQIEPLASKRLTWTIEDSGPGIPPEERARAGDRFFRGRTASTTGSGLGLSIVQQIVDLHGGSLEIDDSLSLGGARLRILLPAT
ncbi:MAG TPA: ATP-binding protein [Kiritimatiellia bacterium]|nr:ATP-binding protein [Kiritimatiellia bacterium]